MAAEPEKSRGTRNEYLAAAGVTGIMNERPMIGPTAAAWFCAILDNSHKASPITVTVAMYDRKKS